MAILNYTTSIDAYKTVAEIENILVKHKAKSIVNNQLPCGELDSSYGSGM